MEVRQKILFSTDKNLPMTCSVSATRKKKRRISANENLPVTRGPSNKNNFKVILIVGDGNCLFWAIFHCLCDTKDRRIKIVSCGNITKKGRAHEELYYW